MPTETLIPSRLDKYAWLWQASPELSFMGALAEAIMRYRAKFKTWPASCHCGDEIPAGDETGPIPVYHDEDVGAGRFWLEHPAELEWRQT